MVMNKVTMLQIDYFLAVAEYLSFTEAAKMLYSSQPSVSKQISSMEKQLGTELFYRTKRTVHLTAAGEVLLKELRGINEQIEGAIVKAKDAGSCEYSTINIGCLEGMNTEVILRFVNKFKCEHKNINLNFERHSFKALRERILNGSLDLAFTLNFEMHDSLGFEYKTVHRTNSCIMVSKASPLAMRDDLKLPDLKDQDFVLISREESPYGFDQVVALCRRHGFTPKIVKQLPNVESLLLSVETGVGVTILDSSIRLHNTDNFRLYMIQDDFIDHLVLWKKENAKVSIKVFTDDLLTYISEENPVI